MSLAQASLAVIIFGSIVATYLALSPPNPSPKGDPRSPKVDLVRRLHLTSKHSTKVVLAPFAVLSLHAASLAYNYDSSQKTAPTSSIFGCNADDGPQVNLITWSTATAIPLALIYFVGVPLRFISYASLGKSFTFALAAPDRLHTGGIYSYVQHPSYTGLVVIFLSNLALLCRTDGVIGCWIPISVSVLVWHAEWPFGIAAVCIFLFGVWTRVKQEERMLKAKFGIEWEEWHRKTARFIPWVF